MFNWWFYRLNFSFLLTFIINNFIDFNLSLTFENIAVGLVISTIIEFLSGIIPAYTASKLDPVEAIRR